jgi:hypothetical protein
LLAALIDVFLALETTSNFFSILYFFSFLFFELETAATASLIGSSESLATASIIDVSELLIVTEATIGKNAGKTTVKFHVKCFSNIFKLSFEILRDGQQIETGQQFFNLLWGLGSN